MGKLKEAWAEIREEFDMKKCIEAVAVCIAAAALIAGFMMVLATENAIWFLLWVPIILVIAFLAGVLKE